MENREYEPKWLTGQEVYTLFASRNDAIAWLGRAVRDRGIVAHSAADPEVDLFRLTIPVAPMRRASIWKADADQIDWADFSIPSPHGMRRISLPTPIEVSASLIRTLLGGVGSNTSEASAASTSNRGRKPAADWDAVELSVQLEIQKRKFPDAENDEAGWNCQADVERFVADLLERRNTPISESTVRFHVGKILNSIKAGN